MTLTKELMDLGASSVELLSELDPAIPALDEADHGESPNTFVAEPHRTKMFFVLSHSSVWPLSFSNTVPPSSLLLRVNVPFDFIGGYVAVTEASHTRTHTHTSTKMARRCDGKEPLSL